MITMDRKIYNFETLKTSWNLFLINEVAIMKQLDNIKDLRAMYMVDFIKNITENSISNEDFDLVLSNLKIKLDNVDDLENFLKNLKKAIDGAFIKTIINNILAKTAINDENQILISQIIKHRKINLDTLLSADFEKNIIIDRMDFILPMFAKNSLLHIAVQNNNWKMAEWLLKNGANPNIKNKDGFTPLHLATNRLKWKMVQLLLENGADFGIKTNENGFGFKSYPLISILSKKVMKRKFILFLNSKKITINDNTIEPSIIKLIKKIKKQQRIIFNHHVEMVEIKNRRPKSFIFSFNFWKHLTLKKWYSVKHRIFSEKLEKTEDYLLNLYRLPNLQSENKQMLKTDANNNEKELSSQKIFNFDHVQPSTSRLWTNKTSKRGMGR